MAIIAKFNIYNSKYLIYMIIWYNNSKIKIIINYMQKKENYSKWNSFKLIQINEKKIIRYIDWILL